MKPFNQEPSEASTAIGKKLCKQKLKPKGNPKALKRPLTGALKAHETLTCAGHHPRACPLRSCRQIGASPQK